jgi:hypothetical protein
MRIVDLPKDKREAGIEFVRREYADALEKFGIDCEQAREIGLNDFFPLDAGREVEIRGPDAE